MSALMSDGAGDSRKLKRVVVLSSVALPFLSSRIADALSSKGITLVSQTALSLSAYARLRRSPLGGVLRHAVDLFWGVGVGLKFLFFPPSADERLVVTSNPPLLPVWVACASTLRGFPFAFLVLDLYPEALIVAKRLRASGLLAAFLEAVAGFTIRNATRVIFLGEQIASNCAKRYDMRNAHAVLVLGPSEVLEAISPVNLDRVKFVYSGNLGPLHAADALVAALEAIARSGVFCGEIQLVLRGSEAKRIGEIAGIESFARVLPPLASEEWRAVMASCAVSLVTLGSGAEHVSFPSKAWSAIACGHALIGVCSQQSDLAQLIERNDLGWVVSPEEPESLATLMVAIASGESKAVAELARKRDNSRRFAELKLTPEALADGWIATVG